MPAVKNIAACFFAAQHWRRILLHICRVIAFAGIFELFWASPSEAKFEVQQCAAETIKRAQFNAVSAQNIIVFKNSSDFANAPANEETFKNMGLIDRSSPAKEFYFILQQAQLAISIDNHRVRHLAAFGFCADVQRTNCTSFQVYFTAPVKKEHFRNALNAILSSKADRLRPIECSH